MESWELEEKRKHASFYRRTYLRAFQLVFPEETVDLIVKVNGHHSGLFKYSSECPEFVTKGIRLGVSLVPSDARI